MSKSSSKIVELRAYGSDKDRTLPKEKLKSSAERLRGPLRLSSMDRIVTQNLLMSGRADNHSCVATTCQVSLECSHLVDYEGNTVLIVRL